MELTVLIILIALAQYVYFTLRVGAGRPKYKVDAPHTTGNETWERLFRVQQNTLEQLIVFIPSIWAFSHYASHRWAWVVGVVFLVGRQLYAWEYVSNPASRVPGMGLTLLANAVLLVGGIVGLLVELF